MAHIPKPRSTLHSRTDIRTLRKNARRYTRSRYLKYKSFGNEIDQIPNLLQNPKYGVCSFIAYQHKFSSPTIRMWKAKIQHDPDYNIKTDYKSKRRSIFTKKEEETLTKFIRTNIIDAGQIFTDQNF